MPRTILGFTVASVISLQPLAAFAAPPLPTVPDGFTIEVAAEAPIVERPVMACFDERGRLFVVDSSGANEPFEKLLKNPPHRIVVIEDTDGDGKFDKRTLFADKLVMPQGVLPYRGAVYTASPPSVWKLEDTDGDGVCDRRTEIVTGFGSNGNGADIHGPFLGPDGWLYLCDGRHGHKVTMPTGKIDQGLAGGIFRFRTDGSGFERVCGGGFDNPVEIDFTEEGEMLGTVNILHGNPRQDCLVHWVEGGVYPRADQEQCLAEFKRTGDLLPPIKEFGHVAVSGMTRYRKEGFGPEYRNNLFITFFNRHKVIRSILERSGSTFTSREEEFLSSEEKDFHPTDVFEDADGSLLVINTGGWFRIGCPVSEIAKPDVLGAIYRVRKKGMRKVGVQTTVPFAISKPQIGQSFARLQELVAGPTPSVRRAAAVALGKLEAARTSLVLQGTDDESDQGDLAKSERAERARSIEVLFDAVRKGGLDRFLEHSILYALIEIHDRMRTLPFLNDSNPEVRRAALIALDQMDDGDLTREEVTPLLDTDDPQLRKTALAVISARKGWATELVGLLRGWLQEERPSDEHLSLLRGTLLAQAGDPAIQQLIAETLAAGKTSPPVRLLLWEVVYRAPLAELPELWLEAVEQTLRTGSPAEIRQVIAIVNERKLEKFDPWVLVTARNIDAETSLRVEALAAVAPRMRMLDDQDFALLVGQVKVETPPLVLLAAARGLADAPLGKGKLHTLSRALPAAGPLALPILLRAYQQSEDEAVGMALVAALNIAPAAENLSADELAGILRKYPERVQKEAASLLKRLGGGSLEEQKTKLKELTKLLDPPGDPKRGHDVFANKKTGCTSCHTIAGDGGRVGPDLTKIGASRSGTDLLEAVVFPSASFAREFRPYVVVTDSGKVHTGIISRQTADAIHLRTADLAEIRIPRAAIEEMKESNTSIMPKGIDTTLSPQELRDLLAYLRELK